MFKVGDVVIAIDQCKIGNAGFNALSIGKRYNIIKVDENYFTIIDDKGMQHLYAIQRRHVSNWSKWFIIEEGSVLRLLSKIDANKSAKRNV